MKRLLKTVIIFMLCTIMAATLLACQEAPRLSPEKINELRAKYPVRGEGPPLIDFAEFPIPMERILNRKPFVEIEITGERIEVSQPYDMNDPFAKEMAKREGFDLNFRYFGYPIKVIRDITATYEAGRELVIIDSIFFAGSTPMLQPGDRVIVPLQRREGEKVYDCFFSVYGMYYVTPDGYVLAAFDEGDSDLAKTGMTKEQALRELNAQRTDPRKSN